MAIPVLLIAVMGWKAAPTPIRWMPVMTVTPVLRGMSVEREPVPGQTRRRPIVMMATSAPQTDASLIQDV